MKDITGREYIYGIAQDKNGAPYLFNIGELVRCKDCKHRETDECPMYYWMEWLIIDEGDGYTDHDFIIHDYTTDDGHCNYGERKGGDDE